MLGKKKPSQGGRVSYVPAFHTFPYNSENEIAVSKIERQLTKIGPRPWFAEREIRPGVRWHFTAWLNALRREVRVLLTGSLLLLAMGIAQSAWSLPIPRWMYLVVFAVFFVGAAFLSWNKQREAHEQAQKHIEELEWLPDRPQLLFDSWGEIPHNHPEANPHPPSPPHCPEPEYFQRGFHFTNDGGGTAHDVSMWKIKVGENVIAIGGEAARIESKQKGFVLVWMDLEHNVQFVGEGFPSRWDLCNAMKIMDEEVNGKAIVKPRYAVDVAVTYRDARHVWYMSYAKMIYNRDQKNLYFGPTSQRALGFHPSEIPTTLLQG